MNKSDVISPLGTILYIFLFPSLPCTVCLKIKKGCICYPTRLRAIVLHFSLWPYRTHSNSAPTATSESVLLITGGNTFVQVPYRAAHNEEKYGAAAGQQISVTCTTMGGYQPQIQSNRQLSSPGDDVPLQTGHLCSLTLLRLLCTFSVTIRLCPICPRTEGHSDPNEDTFTQTLICHWSQPCFMGTDILSKEDDNLTSPPPPISPSISEPLFRQEAVCSEKLLSC